VQLQKYCRFIQAYKEGTGVKETASLLGVHRTTVASWRKGTDVPYAVMLARKACEAPKDGWRWLPSHLEAGGNQQNGWIQVPAQIGSYSDIVQVVGQLRPLDSTYTRAQSFGLDRPSVETMRLELFAYLLGFMLGDASKLGGEQERFTSANLDLQLSLGKKSNLRLGEFVCLCTNALGLGMERKADKQPTGDSKFAQVPVGAFRWNSERSPLLAWAKNVCLGLQNDEITSIDPVHMEWVLETPRMFRIRFIQALADSDATVKPYEVIITSVPNADFTTRVLKSVGMTSAHTIHEKGRPLRTMVSRREARKLPIFNEFAKGYRYERLVLPFERERGCD